MAGSHERGIDAADPRLFEEALTFVTPGRKTSSSALQTVVDFWKKISRRVAVISAEEHDRITAQISHLPHLLAAVLVDSVPKRALPFAASGFLDSTRVAQGDPKLWEPIFRENRKEVRRALRNFETRLKRIKKILATKDLPGLARLLGRSCKRRSSLE